MAKKEKNVAVESAPKAERPSLTKEQKRKLFADVFAAEKEIEAARAVVEQRIVVRSGKVCALKDALGAGPFQIDGQILTVRVRGENAFLVRPGDMEIETI